MTKRKKPSAQQQQAPESESVTTRTAVPAEVMEKALRGELPTDEPTDESTERAAVDAAADDFPGSYGDGTDDTETTVNLGGDDVPLPGRDDLDAPTVAVSGEALEGVDHLLLQRKHLRGLLEALVFASDSPIKPKELAKLASAPVKQVTELLAELKEEYLSRGVHLEEVAGGWVFRTSAQYAPFIRDLTKQRPVRLTRAQVETLAIIAYRQPITRPEIDDVRGVDSGPVLKLLLERDLVRILGKRDEPGRPIIYGTTNQFLEFFGLKSLKDLPTLREFTELTDESREKYEDEMGEPPGAVPPPVAEDATAEGRGARESMKVPVGDDPDAVSIRMNDDGTEELAPDAHDDGPTLASAAPPAMTEDGADADDDDADDDDEDEDVVEEEK